MKEIRQKKHEGGRRRCIREQIVIRNGVVSSDYRELIEQLQLCGAVVKDVVHDYISVKIKERDKTRKKKREKKKIRKENKILLGESCI